MKAKKIKSSGVNLENIKPKKKVIKKSNNYTPEFRVVKLVAQYVGDVEIYFPQFKKIVNKGDLVPELPIKEAKGRSDFIVIESEE